MTSSEVATMDFVRNHLGIPAPKVLAWNSKAETNAVGAEYIIMETAKGVELASVWGTMNSKQKKNVVTSLAALEQNMVNAKFSKYGSLYYKDDLTAAQCASGPLLARGTRNLGATEKFSIGPIAHRNFYEDERGLMNLNRGPCE